VLDRVLVGDWLRDSVIDGDAEALCERVDDTVGVSERVCVNDGDTV
jgi:hypothetical protein